MSGVVLDEECANHGADWRCHRPAAGTVRLFKNDYPVCQFHKDRVEGLQQGRLKIQWGHRPRVVPV